MNLRKLGVWALFVGLALPASAAERPGAISGYVRDASGIPQMGAVVEISGALAPGLTVFTDGAGFYSAGDLLPGLYTIRVTAASFLPALREKIGLHPGGSAHVNVTLNTLLDVMQVGPRRSVPEEEGAAGMLSEIVASGFASRVAGGVGLTGGGGVVGASEIVAPSSSGTELSPFAGTPTPCGPPTPKLSRPFLDLGSSISVIYPRW